MGPKNKEPLSFLYKDCYRLGLGDKTQGIIYSKSQVLNTSIEMKISLH